VLKARFDEEHKDDEQKYVAKPENRVVRVTEQLKVMARAAEYAKNSRSWLQLVSIIRYAWNVFTYDLTNPLELTQTDGWHYILLIAESSLYLIEHL
jgi:predicted nucleotidyltransferase